MIRSDIVKLTKFPVTYNGVSYKVKIETYKSDYGILHAKCIVYKRGWNGFKEVYTHVDLDMNNFVVLAKNAVCAYVAKMEEEAQKAKIKQYAVEKFEEWDGMV
jgi:hypothetical protein